MTDTDTDWRTRPAPPWEQPAVGAHPLDGYRYTSPDFFAAEWDGVWTRVWLLLGRESEMPDPGDYQVEEVGPESIIMSRQGDGSVRAYYNVCQHRGSRLLFADSGHATSIVCPYHGWTYRHDGALVSVKDPQDFSSGDPCDRLGLVELSCETFAGFVWVNMDPGASSLREFLGPIWDDFAAYEPEDWPRTYAATVNVPCNWKVIQDNFHESYHLQTVHPQLEDSIEEDVRYTRFDMADEGHNRMVMRGGAPSRSLPPERLALREPLLSMLRSWDLDPADYAGREYETRTSLQSRMRELGPERGHGHYENLRDEQLTDAYHFNVFPNCSITFAADALLLQRVRPHPTDPQRCVFDHWRYASPASVATARIKQTDGTITSEVSAEREVFDYGTQSLGIIGDQDLGVTTGQQVSFRSRGYRRAELAGQEARISRFHEVIDEYIAAGSRTDRR